MISILCDSCPLVEVLDISNIRGLDREPVRKESLFKLDKLTKLKRLNANWLPIDDEVIEMISQNLKEMRYLSILRSNISYNGLWTLIKNCPKLRELDIKYAAHGIYLQHQSSTNEINEYLELCERELWRKRTEPLTIHVGYVSGSRRGFLLNYVILNYNCILILFRYRRAA